MPDWRAETRERLAGLPLDPADQAAIVEELSQHLEERYQELRARGLAAEPAAAAVREEHLSDSLQEALKRVVPSAPTPPPVLGNPRPRRMAGLWSDLRYGIRVLRRSPGFALVALLTLAIGIGANAAIFSVVNAVLLRPPPFQDPDRLVVFWGTAPDKGLSVLNYPDALYAWYHSRLRTLEPMAMYSKAGFTLTGSGEPERLEGANVTSDFFSVLGARPALGRSLLPDESAPGRNLVAVISHTLWHRHFGGDSQVVGRSVLLDNIATTIVGVMTPGFSFPDRAELWIPFPIDPTSINCWCYDALGRLAPGATPRDVVREIEAANADFWADREGRVSRPPDPDDPAGTVVTPLAQHLVGEARTPILVLLGAVGLVLLIACANLATLLLARATARSRELAVRSALGASPGRIIRQLLVECLLLSLSGAVLGLVLARAGVGVLSRKAVERLTWLDPITLDPVVLGFAIGLGLLTAAFFGLAPALRGTRFDLAASLKEGTRTSGSGSTRRLNDAFVVVQLSLSLVLLVGAGLLLRSFANLVAVDPGFRADNVVVGRIAVPWTVYRDMPQVRQLAARLGERVRALPGVTAAAFSSTAPFSNNDNQQELVVRGQEPGPGEPVPVASIRRVSVGYFQAVGTRLLEGREFTAEDRDSAQPVAIIDETVARRYWPGTSALGQRIRTGGPAWRTVVGVATGIRHQRLDRPLEHYVYYPLEQATTWTLDLVVRSEQDPAGLMRALQAEVQAVDPALPLFDLHTMEQAIDRSVDTRRFTNLLLFGFATGAILLAAIGIYGVMSRNVVARIREFGVRLALGAGPAEIHRLVFGQGMKLLLIGAALGTLGAVALTRLVRGLLFEVTPVDPLTYGGALLILGMMALAACWIPARRATRTDPLAVLRSE